MIREQKVIVHKKTADLLVRISSGREGHWWVSFAHRGRYVILDFPRDTPLDVMKAWADALEPMIYEHAAKGWCTHIYPMSEPSVNPVDF